MFVKVYLEEELDADPVGVGFFISARRIKAFYPVPGADLGKSYWGVDYEGGEIGEARESLYHAYIEDDEALRIIRAASLDGAIHIPAKPGDTLNGKPVDGWIMGRDGVVYGVNASSANTPDNTGVPALVSVSGASNWPENKQAYMNVAADVSENADAALDAALAVESAMSQKPKAANDW